jgi:hypothetical protein
MALLGDAFQGAELLDLGGDSAFPPQGPDQGPARVPSDRGLAGSDDAGPVMQRHADELLALRAEVAAHREAADKLRARLAEGAPGTAGGGGSSRGWRDALRFAAYLGMLVAALAANSLVDRVLKHAYAEGTLSPEALARGVWFLVALTVAWWTFNASRASR